jgi:alpha-D-ribose 1-methylphosphonate 5-triphosphate synthase subunit PhnG
MSQSGLGKVFNAVFAASGVSIPATAGSAVSFIHSQGGTGTATLTFTQKDSKGVLSEIDLNIGTQTAGQENLGSTYWVGPDTGGVWVAKAATSAKVFTLGGATNDTGVVTVRAEQLADGYDMIVGTASAGSLVAVVHDLLVQRKPSNLKSNIVA